MRMRSYHTAEYVTRYFYPNFWSTIEDFMQREIRVKLLGNA